MKVLAALSGGAHKNRGRSQMCRFLQQEWMGGEKCEISILSLASLWNFVADVDGVVLSSTPSSISSFVGHEDDEEPFLGPLF